MLPCTYIHNKTTVRFSSSFDRKDAFSAECYEKLSHALSLYVDGKKLSHINKGTNDLLSLSSQSRSNPFYSQHISLIIKLVLDNILKHEWTEVVFCSQHVYRWGIRISVVSTGTQEAHLSNTYFQRRFGFWNYFHLLCSQYWLQCSLIRWSCCEYFIFLQTKW